MFTTVFIFISGSAHAEEHNAGLYYGKERMLVFGATNVEEGIEVAKRVVEQENCRIIELCGGFSEEDARAVKKATRGKALVGRVVYFDEDAGLVAEIVEELSKINL